MNALLHWLNAPEWSQVVKTLLHSLWQGALITMALVPTMLRLASPYARYRCSLVALAAIPVAGIITWAILNSFNHPPPLAPLPIATEATTPFDLIPLNQNPVTKLTVFAVHTPAPPQSRWTAWLALAWLVGAVAMLGRAGAKVAGAERLRRACQPLDHPQIAHLVTEARRAVGLVRKIRVAFTDKLTSPAVVGVLVPTLILPLSLVTTLTPEQIRFILLHELAHIRRGDYFANLFQLFVEALLFFNPAVWWISHQVRREREACCDALAIELSGAPADYARTLVHVAESILSPTPASATAFGGDREPSSLADRIQRLLVPGYHPSLRLKWRAMIGAFVLGATLLVLSAEGTRVAVEQIAKSTGETKQSTASPQSKEALPVESLTELSNHFANEFSLGESNAPGYVGPKIPAKLSGSPELERVKRNLKDLRFKLVSCSNKPLAEFFLELAEESQSIDPEGNGFRFSILPIRFNSSAATINPPLTNANLLEILAAIQGIPRLELAGVNANGRVTLSPSVPPYTLEHDESQSEAEAEREYSNDTTTSMPDDPHGASVQTEIADRFAINDLVTVKFSDTPDHIPQHEERIRRDGSIVLPLIGAVTAANKTPIQLLKEIHDCYVPAYYKRLTVIVIGEDGVSLVGGRLPARQVYRGATTSAKAIQSAGDFGKYTDERAGGGLPRPSIINSPPIEISGYFTNEFKLGEPMAPGYVGPEIPTKLYDSPERSWLDGWNLPYLQRLRVGESARLSPDSVAQRGRTGVTLASGNSTVVIDPHNQVGMNAWTVDAKSPQNQQWYWHRVYKTNTPGLELTRPQPQINLKVRFVEIDMATVKKFGNLGILLETMPPGKSVAGKADNPTFANFSSSNSVAGSSPSQLTGILTDPQYRAVLGALEQREGADVLALQEVTTVSGGRAELQTVEIKTIVTGINPKALVPPGITSTSKDGSAESLLITTNLRCGPVIDIVPAITPDGYSVVMTVIPRVTEFLGYDGIEHPTNTVVVYENGKKGRTTYPFPRFRTRQMTNNAVVRDGMTLMLAFPPVQKTITTRYKVPVLGDIPGVGRLFQSQSSQTQTNTLFVLVTPTIANPAAKQPDTAATSRHEDGESFLTSTNLRPVIDYLPVINYYEPR